MVTENQIPIGLIEIIDEQIGIYEQGRSVTVINQIPDTSNIPIENPKHWLKIPDVICVFVDMKGSTKLSATSYDQSTAGAYQLFSGTAVKIFSYFESPYIDIKGDGIFALFDKSQPYRAFASAISFKTFTKEVFVPKIKERTKIDIGSHLGIDMKTVLVRKLGFKRYRGRSDRQNEVWAGKPINMAAKLATSSEDNELLVSDRFFQKIQNDFVLKSCGCSNGEYIGEKKYLWSERDIIEDERFDFEKAYSLKSNWCSIHGKEYCDAILKLDN